MADKNNNLVTMAQQFSGLPMKELIGSPLVAAAEANNMMAMSQTKFLLNTCFSIVKIGNNEIYKPVMVNMTLTRPVFNADGSQAEPIESEFNLPLLTIIPLNSLAVDEVNISFEMEVKSSYSLDKSTDSKEERSVSHKLNTNTVSAEISGAVASTEQVNNNQKSTIKKSNSAKYEISAHAAQVPLPIGILTIIETYSQSIVPIHLKADET
ncbi:MAG: DUF2589 domain-containing protein [Colwellia sp.]|nr:DUF2589 domain-containing protein [Colwellia sp.]